MNSGIQAEFVIDLIAQRARGGEGRSILFASSRCNLRMHAMGNRNMTPVMQTVDLIESHRCLVQHSRGIRQ